MRQFGCWEEATVVCTSMPRTKPGTCTRRWLLSNAHLVGPTHINALVLGRFLAEAARVSWSFPLCTVVDRHKVCTRFIWWHQKIRFKTSTSGLKEMSGYLPRDVSVASCRWESLSAMCLKHYCPHLSFWNHWLVELPYCSLSSQVTIVEVASCVILSCYTTEFDGPLTCTRLFRWQKQI